MELKDNWTKEDHSWDYFSAKNFRHEHSARHTFGTDGCDFQERINYERMREYRSAKIN